MPTKNGIAWNDAATYEQPANPHKTLETTLVERVKTASQAAVSGARDFVNKLLGRLLQRDRLLLLWKEVEGFTIRDLSEMTGLNENTIKLRMFRTRQNLIKAAARLRSAKTIRGLVR
jgi:DNA-directed RNA polymerase specialized sigma24 family protein